VQAFEVSAILAGVPGVATVDEVMLFPADLSTGRRGEPTPRFVIDKQALVPSYRRQVRVT
jgi:hypothetical protein